MAPSRSCRVTPSQYLIRQWWMVLKPLYKAQKNIFHVERVSNIRDKVIFVIYAHNLIQLTMPSLHHYTWYCSCTIVIKYLWYCSYTSYTKAYSMWACIKYQRQSYIRDPRSQFTMLAYTIIHDIARTHHIRMSVYQISETKLYSWSALTIYYA